MLLTDHALIRAAQRGVSLKEIDSVIAHGHRIHCRGADHYIMRWREVEMHARRGRDLKALEGYRVVCAPTGEVLTVYRQARRRHSRPRPSLMVSSRRKTSFKAGSDALLKRLQSFDGREL